MANKKKKTVNKNEPKRYTCPDCGWAFNPPDRVKKKFCGQCGIELRADRRKNEGTGFHYVYLAVSNSKLPVESPNLDSKEEVEQDELGTLISAVGEIPKVWLVDEGEEETKEEGLTYKATYRVRYEGVIHTSWVYCPNCESPMFQNMMTSTGGADQEHLCRQSKCKAKVLVGFMADLTMGARTMIFNR